MGGKKKKGKGFFDQAARVASGAINGGIKTVTAGTVDLENQKFSLNPETMANNFAGGITGQDVMAKLAPEGAALEEVPEVIDPVVQEKAAEAKVASAFEEKYGGNKAGLASTLLGGSESQDTAVLKKKKLLGA